MNDWVETTLGNLVSLQRGHDLPAEKREDGNVPIMGSFGLTGLHSVSKSAGPGVTVGRSGASIGVVNYIEEDYWPLNTCLYSTDFHGNNPKFVYYFLKTVDLAAHNSGSAQPSLNRNYIAPLKIQIPCRAMQDKIVWLLNSLDDKIELNRRMNETLEAMAQAIFKDWFVDFGPTRRKLAGETDPVAILGGLLSTPEQATPIADLFPDTLGDNGLPVGWENKSIYDFANVVYGAPYKSKLFNNDGYGRPLVRIRDLSKHQAGQFTEEVHKKEHVIRAGDIVVGMDGEFRAYLWQGVPSLMNQRICNFRPHSIENKAFVWLAIQPLLRSLEETEIATTVIHLGKRDIDRFTLVFPRQDVLSAFAAVAGPVVGKVVLNGEESKTLAQTRDLLLPKLMSGEIRVAEAEAMAAEVA